MGAMMGRDYEHRNVRSRGTESRNHNVLHYGQAGAKFSAGEPMTARLALVSFVFAVGCAGTQVPGASAPQPQPSASQPSASQPSTPQPSAAEPDRTQAAVLTALAGAQRSDKNRPRDVYRHPAQTLAFFGLTESAHVIELWPGAGWYTEVLAPVLRDSGALTAVVPAGPGVDAYRAFLATVPALYDRVGVVTVQPPAALDLGPDASADLVLTFRNIHNWLTGNFASELTGAVFRVLKPGGIYGVVEHRAKPGTSLEVSQKSGYVTEDLVIELATKAGFVLDARSEVNANPKDTKDYPKGVWALPPALIEKDVDRDKYLQIGESDRMTLRFRKP
jgi:predicted methyltransferase